MSVVVFAFSKGQFVVKLSAYKIDVLSSPKATFRLAVGCERLKKIISKSANTEVPLSVESIMNDVASSKLSRNTYEEFIAPALDRIAVPLQQALAEFGLTLDQIDAVKLLGRSTRILATRARIQAALASNPFSPHLNQDEAVARGATFACAFFSPAFRVREFHIRDTTPYPTKVSWDRLLSDPDDDTELVVFPTTTSSLPPRS